MYIALMKQKLSSMRFIFSSFLLVNFSFGFCLVCLSGWPAEARSGKENFKQALCFYESGNFRLAFEKFREAALSEPYNARLRYYLGNCLVKLGKIEEARTSFRACLSLHPEPEVSSGAWLALQNLDKFETSNSNPKLPDFLKTDVPVSLSRQVLEGLARLNEEKLARLRDINSLQEAQRLTLSKQLDYDINSVPKYIYLGDKRVANPDRGDIVASLKEQFNQRLAILKADGEKRKAEADSFYTKEQDKLKETGANLAGQYASSGGENKAISTGSSLYVRNYVNFGPAYEEEKAPPVPTELTAAAASLKISPDKAKLPSLSKKRK